MRILLAIGLLLPLSAEARSLYLNGIDISSVRSQLLEGVSVRIDQSGNVFIDGPQYQVNEEQARPPLAKGSGLSHEPAAPLPKARKEVGETVAVPLTPAANLEPTPTPKATEGGELKEKEGSKVAK